MRTQSQRQILIAYLLVHNHITTLEARNDLFIMSPAARIMELKQQGNNIITNIVQLGDSYQAQYVLLNDEMEVEQ
jgi:hypothetical protein